ncbi:DUF3817 domain-containing protein [Actinoalloteichus sp. AHMU CJ021]|uniref:Integral membrane protein n=1 Tax=Actinoalloteichus caeruleus DSM 43889 TaxID=1120930 RepID=A0ABT1JBL3_ACTCY|nr:DUF3817 domain-containing protein [Actinoalloteichus sp. AHMU CJ021]MCP2329888.1 integral membrane protein [Actinoalloteichus caeruleus DSM 43889]
MTSVDKQPQTFTVPMGALTRFRVLAFVTGVCLLILVLVAMPLRYLAEHDLVMTIIGPVHGFAYMVYLVFAFDLAMKCRWSIKGTVLVLLAGTVPFFSFVAERKVTTRLKAGERI